MPVPRLGRSPRLRHLQCVVIALTSLLLMSACQSTASVELTEGTAASANTTADSSATTSDGDTTTPPTPEDGPADSSAADDGDATSEESGGDESSAGDDALFELRGELPLDTEDVNSLIRFIEAETGRAFLRPPVIVAQSQQEFIDGLQEDVSEFEESAEKGVRSLQALGLTTLGVEEVTDAFIALLLSPEGILGYYDPEVDEFYVPVDASGDDEFRSLLVHELTHALDGQHADLNSLSAMSEEADVTGDFEPLLAFQAVVEGRASSVQNRWMRENNVPAPDPADLDTASLESVPPALVLSLSVPYGFGEQYIEAEGGPAETWQLLDTPPASSEEFMIPDAKGETIVDVPTPPADGPVIDEVVFGAADMLIWLLGESLEPSPTMIFPTFAALDGWAGGKQVVWGDETESCTRITFAADSALDLNEIRTAVELWAEGNPDRSVVSEGDWLTVTGCAPYVP